MRKMAFRNLAIVETAVHKLSLASVRLSRDEVDRLFSLVDDMLDMRRRGYAKAQAEMDRLDAVKVPVNVPKVADPRFPLGRVVHAKNPRRRAAR